MTFAATAGGDALLVHKAGSETITGDKSFTGVVNLTAPGSKFYRNVDNAITASTTQTNTGATQLTGVLSRVSVCANNYDGVKLGGAVKGSVQKVTNDGAKPCIVYPNIGQSINGLTVAAGSDTPTTAGASKIYLPPGATFEFVCSTDGEWRVNVDRGQIFTKQVTLTNAQILALNGTAIQAVAATNNATEMIVPIAATMAYTFSTAAYATNTVLALIHSGSTVPILKTSIAQASSTFAKFFDNSIAVPVAGNNIIANADLNLFVPTGNPTGGNAGASIKITIAYMILSAI